MSLIKFDGRKRPDPYPVARWQENYPIAAGGSEVNSVITDLNGMGKQIHFKVPDLELAGSGNAIFKDMDGNILYETGSQADATTTVLSGDFIPFCGDMSIFITTAGSPAAADGSVWLTIYYV